MTIQNMNETPVQTMPKADGPLLMMRKVLENRPLLGSLREPDREELIQLYMAELEKWENRKNG